MIGIPRIQGKVGQCTEPEDIKGKWFFEIWLTTIGAGDENTSMGMFGPFDSESKAMSALKEACKLACESIEKNIVGETSGKYLDMKTNLVRDWIEH